MLKNRATGALFQQLRLPVPVTTRFCQTLPAYVDGGRLGRYGQVNLLVPVSNMARDRYAEGFQLINTTHGYPLKQSGVLSYSLSEAPKVDR